MLNILLFFFYISPSCLAYLHLHPFPLRLYLCCCCSHLKRFLSVSISVVVAPHLCPFPLRLYFCCCCSSPLSVSSLSLLLLPTFVRFLSVVVANKSPTVQERWVTSTLRGRVIATTTGTTHHCRHERVRVCSTRTRCWVWTRWARWTTTTATETSCATTAVMQTQPPTWLTSPISGRWASASRATSASRAARRTVTSSVVFQCGAYIATK